MEPCPAYPPQSYRPFREREGQGTGPPRMQLKARWTWSISSTCTSSQPVLNLEEMGFSSLGVWDSFGTPSSQSNHVPTRNDIPNSMKSMNFQTKVVSAKYWPKSILSRVKCLKQKRAKTHFGHLGNQTKDCSRPNRRFGASRTDEIFIQARFIKILIEVKLGQKLIENDFLH